jgi:hypothetical protein
MSSFATTPGKAFLIPISSTAGAAAPEGGAACRWSGLDDTDDMPG